MLFYSPRLQEHCWNAQNVNLMLYVILFHCAVSCLLIWILGLVQYHNLNIGDGCVISVTKADFGSTKPSTSANAAESPTVAAELDIRGPMASAHASGTRAVTSGVSTIASDRVKTEAELLIERKLRAALPAESLASSHAVALLSNVYNPSDPACVTDPNFFLELEVPTTAC
jgi:hypothetical protein